MGRKVRATKANGPEETKRERFHRLAPKRVQRALDAIRVLGNCGSSLYESDEAELEKVKLALEAAVAEAIGRMRPREKKAREAFSF